MKKYKVVMELNGAYSVYVRRMVIFWELVKSYSSYAKAVSAAQMFKLNDKKRRKK